MRNIVFLVALAMLASCSGNRDSKDPGRLPIMGNKYVEDIKLEDGVKADTVYHTIPDFEFTDQDGNAVTPQTFEGKVYIADFFFTTCPTICPVMKKEMLRVYEAFLDNEEVAILSHTIDPEHDSVAVLRDFAEKLGVESYKWHFVTGDKEEIYRVGMKGYLVTAGEDASAPGGYIHSGAFILVDKDRRIRGLYDGTKSPDVNALIRDVKVLLKEYQ